MEALTSYMAPNKDIKSVYIIGQNYAFGQAVSRAAKEYLKRHAERPVDFVGEAPQASLKDALLFVSDRAPAFDPSVEEQQERNLHIVRERDLCDRFGLVPA